jgi:hypothetical protein
MITFVLQRGAYLPAKMEYSYARRAQSVTKTLQWIDTAILEVPTAEEAIETAATCISEWKAQGFRSERWRLEGRGAAAGQYYEVTP